MCLYYYLMLKRFAKVSVYFYLVLKSSPSHPKPKAYSFPMTGSKGQRPKQHWPTEKQWTVSDPPLYKIQWGSRKIKLYIWLRVTKAWYGSPIIFLGISKFIIFIECILTIAKIVVINNWEEMLINFEVQETLQLHHNLEEKYAITISFKKWFLKISTIKVSFWFLNLSFEWSINVTNQTLFLILFSKFNHMI